MDTVQINQLQQIRGSLPSQIIPSGRNWKHHLMAWILRGEAWAMAHKMMSIFVILWATFLPCTVIITSLEDSFW